MLREQKTGYENELSLDSWNFTYKIILHYKKSER